MLILWIMVLWLIYKQTMKIKTEFITPEISHIHAGNPYMCLLISHMTIFLMILWWQLSMMCISSMKTTMACSTARN